MANTTSSLEADARSVVQELFAFIEAQGHGDYLGEDVSQLQHTLQAATLAEQAGADEETIIGALLHDVGRFIPASDKMPAMIAPDGNYVGKASHEMLGERYLRQLGFSEMICQLVGAHVVAKRYLCAVDREYWAGLSRSSKQTLVFQVHLTSSFHQYYLLTNECGRAVHLTTSKSRRHRRIRGYRINWRSADGMTKPRIRTWRRHHSHTSKR